MPWYWSDEIARVLVDLDKIDGAVATSLTSMPVAFRRECDTIEMAAEMLLDDDEIPSAA